MAIVSHSFYLFIRCNVDPVQFTRVVPQWLMRRASRHSKLGLFKVVVEKFSFIYRCCVSSCGRFLSCKGYSGLLLAMRV